MNVCVYVVLRTHASERELLCLVIFNLEERMHGIILFHLFLLLVTFDFEVVLPLLLYSVYVAIYTLLLK